jgi:threonine dehydrogenase-like Zn-dependent dehydrogenase
METNMAQIKVARLHQVGQPMKIETIAEPALRPHDVRIKVQACNVVPNLHNILANWTTWFPYLPLPKLPAVFGLDSSGIVCEVGEQVRNFSRGDRVYVNPGLSCGSCAACLRGSPRDCKDYVFIGYFGFTLNAQPLYDAYPSGGLAETLVAPDSNLVRLPDNVSFEQGARFGYLGTAFSALKKAGVRPDTDLLILGGTGTLGLGAVLCALALGVRRITCTARIPEVMDSVKALAPERIEMLNLDDGRVAPRVLAASTEGGVEIVVNCLGPGAPAEQVRDALGAIRRGGRFVNISGVGEPVLVDIFKLMCGGIDVLGSNWSTVGEGHEMAALAASGLLDLSCLEHRRYKLEAVNDLISSIPDRHGGFTNFIVTPND